MLTTPSPYVVSSPPTIHDQPLLFLAYIPVGIAILSCLSCLGCSAYNSLRGNSPQDNLNSVAVAEVVFAGVPVDQNPVSNNNQRSWTAMIFGGSISDQSASRGIITSDRSEFVASQVIEVGSSRSPSPSNNPTNLSSSTSNTLVFQSFFR